MHNHTRDQKYIHSNAHKQQCNLSLPLMSYCMCFNKISMEGSKAVNLCLLATQTSLEKFSAQMNAHPLSNVYKYCTFTLHIMRQSNLVTNLSFSQFILLSSARSEADCQMSSHLSNIPSINKSPKQKYDRCQTHMWPFKA